MYATYRHETNGHRAEPHRCRQAAATQTPENHKVGAQSGTNRKGGGGNAPGAPPSSTLHATHIANRPRFEATITGGGSHREAVPKHATTAESFDKGTAASPRLHMSSSRETYLPHLQPLWVTHSHILIRYSILHQDSEERCTTRCTQPSGDTPPGAVELSFIAYCPSKAPE